MPVPDDRPVLVRANLLIAATQLDAVEAKRAHPILRRFLVATPRTIPCGYIAGALVWTPAAEALPATTRLKMRGEIAPMIDEYTAEGEFPRTSVS